MDTKLMLAPVVALGGGLLAAYVTSETSFGSALSAGASRALAPVADLMTSWRDSRPLFSPGSDGSPTSTFDIFMKSGKPDADFASCVGAIGPDLAKSAQDLFGSHTHAATTSFVDCYLTRNPVSFCAPDGQTRAVAVAEFYYWARENSRHPSHRQEMAYKMNHLEDDTALGPGAGGDSYEITWNGPQDDNVVRDIQSLLHNGYLDANAFGLFPREELRKLLQSSPRARDGCGTARRD